MNATVVSEEKSFPSFGIIPIICPIFVDKERATLLYIYKLFKQETRMKRHIVNTFAILLATSFLLGACGKSKGKEANAVKADSIQVNETVHLFGDSTKPACNLIVNFAYASETADVRLKDSLNSYFLAFCFGDKYGTEPVEEGVQKYAHHYVSNYRKDLEPMYQKDLKEAQANGMEVGSWYSYYQNIQSRIQLCAGTLLTYRKYYEEYTGGAHGIYMTTYLNLDLRTLVPIRLADLFVGDYEEPLTDLLWNQLMADNQVTTHAELEELGYTSTGDLQPTENFYLDKQGITFVYNVYEIAPYAMGAIQITLPYASLSHLESEELTRWRTEINA